MNLIRKNLFDIVTVIVFAALIFHCRQSPDTPGWIVLFLLITLNALLFIFKKPIAMISWFAIVIGILGMVMSLPAVIESGVAYANGRSAMETLGMDRWHTVMYFMITILFGSLQVHRLLRHPRNA